MGDMLVGKQGYKGLLCGSLGGVFCSRPLVVGVVSAVFLLPAVSFRSVLPTYCHVANLDLQFRLPEADAQLRRLQDDGRASAESVKTCILDCSCFLKLAWI